MSEWVSDKHSQWSDSGPIKIIFSLPVSDDLMILENIQYMVDISDHCHKKFGLSSSPSSYQSKWNMGKIWVGWRSNLCFIEVMAKLIQRGRHHLVGTSQEWLRWLSIFIWSVTNLYTYQTQFRSLPCLVSPSVRHCFLWILFRWVLWAWWAQWVSCICWAWW